MFRAFFRPGIPRWTALVLAAWAAPALPAVYYVAPAGADSDPGSAAQPWRTVEKAAATAVAGDTVYFQQGRYTERLTPANSGAPGAYITFAAQPGHVVTLDVAGIGTSTYFQGAATLANVGYIRIEGMRFVNSGAFGAIVHQSHHVELVANSIYNTRHSGIGVWNSHHVIVDGNEVEHAVNGGEQESLSVSQSYAVQVSRNHVHHNAGTGYGGEGINVKNGSSEVLVKGNHVHDLDKVCLYVDAWENWTHDIVLDGNLVHDCHGIAVASERGGLLDRVTVQNNVVYRNYSFGFAVGDWGAPGFIRRFNDIRVINNTFGENGWANGTPRWGGGIMLLNNPGETVSLIGFTARNNILSRNTTFQILDRMPSLGSLIEHNLIDGVVDGESGSIRGANHITGDPLFVNAPAGDFRLQPGSPAIDQGKTVSAPAMDFDNRNRPANGAPDLGAFESPYGASTASSAVLASFNGQSGSDVTVTNPVSVDLDFVNAGGREAFLLYRDPLGQWFSVGADGQPRALPADRRDIPPVIASAPAFGRANLVAGVAVPPGSYEVHVSLDFHRDDRLTFIGDTIYGVAAVYRVTVLEPIFSDAVDE